MTSPEPPYPPSEPEVPVWVPFAAMFVVLFLVTMFSAALYGVISATDPSIDDTDDLPIGVTQALTFFQDLIFVFAGWIAVKVSRHVAPREYFGLRRPTSVREAVKWSFIAYAIFWAAAIVLAGIFGDPPDQPLVEDLKEEDALGTLLIWAVLICLLAPIVEEFFFRGFMFTVFQRRLGLWWGVALSSAIFGLGHVGGDPIQLAALAAFGVGLCLLYWHTKSIIPCMALHALNNSITFGVTKDLDPAVFAGTVVCSVGAVIALGTAVSSRARVAA